MELLVNLGKDSYPIIIEQGILDSINEEIKKVYSGNKIVIISDDNVYPIYGDKITASLEVDYNVNSIILEHGEKSKSFTLMPSIYSQLLQYKLTRSDLIIALGGGVVGDLAGFIASTYLRGVNFVQIPTSLLAQVDSSVGGKVAVDLPEGKNLVGAFKHPKLVLIDPNTLDTLDQRYINDGMGEVIKYGCIKDKQLFDKLNNYDNFQQLKQDITDVIYTCVNIKRVVVEGDLFDFGERMLLNFGHTLGHAIEQYYNFETYSHGEAVAIGMVAITEIAQEKNLTVSGTAKQIKDICLKYDLPISSDVETTKLLEAISHDKKNIGSSLNVVLLKEIGDSYTYKTTNQFFETKGNK